MIKLPVAMSLEQIAGFIGGTFNGPSDLVVESIATSPMAAGEFDLAFVFDKQFIKQIDQCKAKAVVVPQGIKVNRPYISVARPNYAIYKMLTVVEPKRHMPGKGIHPTAVIDPSCQISDEAAIGPLVVIGPKTKIGARTIIMANTVIGGEVLIGEDCLIHPSCMIADRIQIGNRVILQQGASLGADGFGYVTERPSNMELRMAGINELSDEPNPLLKVQQIGTVIIEDDVEIGSNSTIDRATIGATRIGQGTKIDNLVMIAHNCQIGKEVFLLAQVGIAGSCNIGDRTIVAGQAGMKDHTKIGKDVIIESQAGVMKDIADKDVQLGSPAFAAKDFMTVTVLSRKLPSLFDKFKKTEKRMLELENELEEIKKSIKMSVLEAAKK